MSTPSEAARFSATALSCGVVVGERNSSVSLRMQVSIAPRIGSGRSTSPIRSYMIVAVQATGRMVMSIGLLVSSPPVSLW